LWSKTRRFKAQVYQWHHDRRVFQRNGWFIGELNSYAYLVWYMRIIGVYMSKCNCLYHCAQHHRHFPLLAWRTYISLCYSVRPNIPDHANKTISPSGIMPSICDLCLLCLWDFIYGSCILRYMACLRD
jgi:hypothetical protein